MMSGQCKAVTREAALIPRKETKEREEMLLGVHALACMGPETA